MSAIHQNEVNRVRLQLTAFVLPRPERIAPARADPTGDRSDTPFATYGEDDWASAESSLDSAELRSSIHAALAGWSADRLAPVPAQPWTEGSAEDPHDNYFRIARAEATDDPHYLQAVVGGLDLFLREVATTDELADYECIGLAMLDLWSVEVGDSVVRTAQSPPGTMLRRAVEPVRRWVHGHQLFAVITQGLIRTLHGFEQASIADDEAAMRAALQRMTRLYRASAAALRFTADFDPTVYERSIRPSMSEPHLPAGFSGTLSADHGHLVSLLKSLGPSLGSARSRCPTEYAAMADALAQVYDDHKWVCARFTGASSASLLTGSVGGDRSATDMLDRFKARRVGSLLS